MPRVYRTHKTQETAAFVFMMAAILMANSIALGFCIGSVYGQAKINKIVQKNERTMT